ncbi:MAG TPA: (2Fe-2S)-binding protein [Sphingomonadaceae bacterium]|nr:(2Fe-2S)-binding protein [Sphingomonadaceae bacterium]
MAETFTLKINGETHNVEADSDTPLLYVLMNDLDLKGPKFGCGLAQCGACSVLVDGRETRSCVYPVSAVRNAEVTTLEGLPQWQASASGGDPSDPAPHPVQAALIELQAPQCGYCYGGIAVKAAELLAQNPTPSEAEIVAHMDGHLCRCGTYPRIVAAIQQAAKSMGGAA